MTDADARCSARCRCKGSNNDGKDKATARKGGKQPDQKLNGLIVLRAMNLESIAIAEAKVPIAALLMLLTPNKNLL